MQFPVYIEQSNGTYTASVLGDTRIRAAASSRAAAVAALRHEIARHVEAGDLTLVDVPTTGVTTFAGIFADDPTLDEIVREAYRRRDAEPYE
jgi:hypothetical protein